MGMVVQHNINALTAYNKLNTNVAGLKKSSEKLASGYRINRAGDDAAGLAVSEKMRSQIRGLNQAVRNAQDGINMIQTFEGAATNTHEILQRMKVLAEESSNGTYDNTTDRDAIQLEFDQLNDELNQIADTDFNGRLALNGGIMADGSVASNNDTVAGKPYVASNKVQDPASAVGYKGGVQGAVNYAGTGTIVVDGVSIDVVGGATENPVLVGDTSYEVADITVGGDGQFAGGTITATTELKVNADASEVTIYGKTYQIQRDDATGAISNLWYDVIEDDGTVTATDAMADGLINSSGEVAASGTVDGGLTVTRTYEVKAEDTDNGYANGTVTIAGSTDPNGKAADGSSEIIVGNIQLKRGVSVSDAFEHGRRNLTYSNSITLQTGARSKDAVDFTFAYTTSGIGDLTADLDISARGLGTNQLSVITAEKANEAIDHIDNAINKVSMVRATFGAIQNRLEYKIDNLTTTSTNLTEAESNIRDTDMANEMVNYTKFNILQQAAQSMLAQANQQPQSILQLLG